MVSANAASISVSDDTVVDNQTVNVTVVATDDDGTLTISTSDADDILSSVSCSGAGSCTGAVSGSGTSSVSINTDSPNIDADTNEDELTVSLSLKVDCDSASETIVVSASQGVTRTATLHCGTSQSDTNITIRKDADTSNASFRFVFEVSGGSCQVTKGGALVESGTSGDFFLSDSQSARFNCTSNAVVTITEDIDSSLVDVEGCSGEAGVSVGSRSVRVNTAQSDSSVTCTFDNDVVSKPASIQLSATVLTPNCGTQSVVSAYVIDSDGSAADNGTVVTFAVSAGLLSSTTASTVNGVASVTYIAPANFANLVTITATTGSAAAQGQLRVVCVTGSTTTQPTPPPATPTPRPAAPPVVVAPSAGDGGVLHSDAFSWSLFAGILLAAAVSMGIAFVMQKDKGE
jgi:hypothetical protein